MADDVVRTPVVGKLLWRCRRLLIVLALLGAVLGASVWLILPQSFTSVTKVLLQGSSDESQISTAAEIAMGRVVVQRAVTGLGWAPNSVAEDAVSADATQGSVITISATADTPGQARALAAAVAEEYIKFSTAVADRAAEAAADALSGRREDLQRRIDELSDSGSSELIAARRSELLQSLHELEQQVADERTEAAVGAANIQVIEPATTPETSSTPTLWMLTAGGAALAAVVGATALVASRLADRRLRRRSDIAAALGAPVLGTVATLPDTDGAAGRRTPLRWLLGTSNDTNAAQSPEEERLELLRYSRVLERLCGVSDGPLRITVVTADDDEAATRAVARLVTAADATGRPVAVLGDNHALTSALGDGTAERSEHHPESPAGTEDSSSGEPSGYPYGIMLRAVAVPARRPTVPRDSTASGAVIVTTSGTRTNWELLVVAEACRDAMLPVLGALVVMPVGEEEDVEAGSRTTPSEPNIPIAARVNGHVNGSTA